MDPRAAIIKKLYSYEDAKTLLDHDYNILFERKHKFRSEVLANFTSLPQILSMFKLRVIHDYEVQQELIKLFQNSKLVYFDQPS